ncbi:MULTISPECIES: flavodoxin [Roseateles]|uniref:Flavodoxin n=1 Tax=Pelomonas caseinilytica TaxID=2906763 RepID=A0ABS8XBX4_9BURK|nr:MULTISPECIES: flavodoxin [unclassified Roseateles]MCE4536872.1 flavodoxin [Pelomonas sp. P7]HEV6967502.1 flavodoxin [Roseateles sp.]
MSKILVVTYSFTGTGARLTELLCRSRDWASAQVVERRPRRRFVTWRCAIESFFRLRPAIVYDGPDPADFDLVVLVAPIWLQQMASPMRSFVASFRGRLRRVAVISVMGGKGGQNAPAEIGTLLDLAPLMSTTFTMREVDDGSYAPRLLAFAVAVQASVDATGQLRPFLLSPEAAG